jgi:hypothetical protein
MRTLAVAALGFLGCGGAAQKFSPADSGTRGIDAAAEVGGGPEVLADRVDADDTNEAREAGTDVPDQFRCSTIAPLILSDPTVISGILAAGQTATLQITLTDTDPNGYVSYPGVVLTSSNPGVAFVSESGPPGASIDGRVSKLIPFTLTFDAAIPSGTEVAFSARVYGWGHPAPDCPGAFVLAFSLTVR